MGLCQSSFLDSCWYQYNLRLNLFWRHYFLFVGLDGTEVLGLAVSWLGYPHSISCSTWAPSPALAPDTTFYQSFMGQSIGDSSDRVTCHSFCDRESCTVFSDWARPAIINLAWNMFSLLYLYQYEPKWKTLYLFPVSFQSVVWVHFPIQLKEFKSLRHSINAFTICARPLPFYKCCLLPILVSLYWTHFCSHRPAWKWHADRAFVCLASWILAFHTVSEGWRSSHAMNKWKMKEQKDERKMR